MNNFIFMSSNYWKHKCWNKSGQLVITCRKVKKVIRIVFLSCRQWTFLSMKFLFPYSGISVQFKYCVLSFPTLPWIILRQGNVLDQRTILTSQQEDSLGWTVKCAGVIKKWIFPSYNFWLENNSKLSSDFFLVCSPGVMKWGEEYFSTQHPC